MRENDTRPHMSAGVRGTVRDGCRTPDRRVETA